MEENIIGNCNIVNLYLIEDSVYFIMKLKENHILFKDLEQKDAMKLNK